MGQLTRGELITEGMLLAGDDTVHDRVAIWLNAWLRKMYTGWQFPFLKRRASGIALTAGATSVSVGAGSGGITQEIFRIFEPIYGYTSDKKEHWEAPIMELIMAKLRFDESGIDPASNLGQPGQFKCRSDASLYGRWSLIPFPFPVKNYLLAFDYHVIPANLTLDSQVPIYPNDRTLIQACKVAALEYSDGPESTGHDQALATLSSMVVDDRDQFGNQAGDNEFMLLDSSVFR